MTHIESDHIDVETYANSLGRQLLASDHRTERYYTVNEGGTWYVIVTYEEGACDKDEETYTVVECGDPDGNEIWWELEEP